METSFVEVAVLGVAVAEYLATRVMAMVVMAMVTHSYLFCSSMEILAGLLLNDNRAHTTRLLGVASSDTLLISMPFCPF